MTATEAQMVAPPPAARRPRWRRPWWWPASPFRRVSRMDAELWDVMARQERFEEQVKAVLRIRSVPAGMPAAGLA